MSLLLSKTTLNFRLSRHTGKHILKPAILLKTLRTGLFFLLCLSSIATFSDETRIVLTFAYEDKENYPAFVGSGAEIPDRPGTYVEILREVTARLGMELRLERMPWNRALRQFELGEIDAINGSFKPSREAFAQYPRTDDGSIDSTKHITRDAYVLYVPAGSPLRWDGNGAFINTDSRQTTIGTSYNYSIAETLRSQRVPVIENPGGFEPLIRTLLADRVQGIVVHERPMQYYLLDNPEFSAKIEKTSPAVQAKHYYIMLSKAFVAEYPELSEAFWQTVEDVRSEQLDGLMTEYEMLRK